MLYQMVEHLIELHVELKVHLMDLSLGLLR